MAWFSECQDTFPSRAPGEDDDEWGSDFEGESCSQEIEDSKINEIREANFLKNSPNNIQDLTESNSQTLQAVTGNRTKTGAIPKSGFSYLNNVIPDSYKTVQTTGKESGNIFHTQRQMSQPAYQSRNAFMNPENLEIQSQAQISANNDAVAKNTPRKLKPEAFSFLNKLPQRNVTENGNEAVKERTPTAFFHAEKLAFSKLQDDTLMKLNESLNEFVNETPSAPPLENTTGNYEAITEDSMFEFALQPVSTNVGKEIVKPPLPSRPPPVFKYPPETFLSLRSTSTESSGNPTISCPLSQSSPSFPKLGHSISSPNTGLNYASEDTMEQILSSKEKNRRSLPSTAVCSAVPKRPLPPLPISHIENVRIKSHDGTNKLEHSASINEENVLEEGSIGHGTKSICQTNVLSACEVPIQQTAFKELALQEQLFSNSQHRLAQILTNQTSVNSAVLLSQQKIAAAITARVSGSQSSSISRLNNSEDSEFQNDKKPQELIRVIPRRTLENDAEQKKEDESEQQPSSLEAKETVNSRRFTDHETLINAMNRPVLPQKAAPIQRSVSCNSLVQSIKDLSFSVWSKPEKKRNSDGISLSKKNPRSMSVASSSKVKCTTPVSITLIPTSTPSEVINSHGKIDAVPIDEKGALQEYPWFHNVDAKEGHLRLLSVGQNGTFLVRPSSRPTEDIQNTLCILYNSKIRNLHIRNTQDGRYVLGTKSNKNFSSLADMIRHHKEVPVEILSQTSTPIKPQLYRILLRETPPKLQKQFSVVY